MKKKVCCTLACVAMVSVIAMGCGVKRAKDDSKKRIKRKRPLVIKNSDEKLSVIYLKKTLTPFHAPINDYAKETFDALKKDGTIDDWTGVLDGETDANKQIDRADECIAKKCDYVIILPAEATASDAAVKDDRCASK